MPIQQALFHEPPAATTVVGQQEYTSPGSYSWTCPSEVNEVHVVCIGGGGGGQTQDFKAGGGGGLGKSALILYQNFGALLSSNKYLIESDIMYIY